MTIGREIDANVQVYPPEPPIRLAPGRSLPTLVDGQTNEPTLLAEAALAEDWLKPEEDEAWAHLQPDRR